MAKGKAKDKDTDKAKFKVSGQPPKLSSKEYTKELRKLQAELCTLQEWVRSKGTRVIVVFEGRDAAGKCGVIKAITERVSPRVFRVVALPAPSDREKTQRSATPSRSGASRPASRIRCASGSSAPWTCRHGRSGLTTRAPAT